MKIALLWSGPLIESVGGVERFVCEMANTMANKGLEVCLIGCEGKEGRPFYPLDSNVIFKNLGIDYHVCITDKLKSMIYMNRSKRREMREYFCAKRVSAKLENVIKEFSPDIFFANDLKSAFALKKVLHSYIPTVYIMHGNPKHVLNDCPISLGVLESLELVCVLLPDYIDVVNDILEKHNLKSIQMIAVPNKVPSYEVCNSRREERIIHLGRIDSDSKKQFTLVRAFGLIAAKYRDWSVHFYGPVDRNNKAYLEDILSYIKSNNLDQQIFFHKSVDNVKAVLDQGSIFAFPSANEGFPLALTEAMSSGLACIGMRACPGVNSLIKDGVDGILSEDDDESFAKSLERLMLDSVLRSKLGYNAHLKMQEYTAEKIWLKWESIFSRVKTDTKGV